MAALSPGQFKGTLYHGTTHDIVGRDVVPSNAGAHTNNVWGDMGHSGQRSNEHAFATESEDTAWKFADAAGINARYDAMRSRQDVASAKGRGVEHLSEEAPEPSRARVHTVSPNPQMQPGVYHHASPSFGTKGTDSAQDLKEWRAPAFRVTGRIDIKPGHQGTFPELNWNQFRGGHASVGMEANHPTDDAISEGHEPMFNTPRQREWNGRAKQRQENKISQGTGTLPKGFNTTIVSPDQMDLFTGRTSRDHAENDSSKLGEFHSAAAYGRI